MLFQNYKVFPRFEYNTHTHIDGMHFHFYRYKLRREVKQNVKVLKYLEYCRWQKQLKGNERFTTIPKKTSKL